MQINLLKKKPICFGNFWSKSSFVSALLSCRLEWNLFSHAIPIIMTHSQACLKLHTDVINIVKANHIQINPRHTTVTETVVVVLKHVYVRCILIINHVNKLFLHLDILLHSGVAQTWLNNICTKRSDWLTYAFALEKFFSFCPEQCTQHDSTDPLFSISLHSKAMKSVNNNAPWDESEHKK